jgi:DNA-binding PadR family transcriptional regulator
MINNYQKEIQTKLTRNLINPIILQCLDKESMHGYQLITKIRKDFGIYLGPSTVYPLLGQLEKGGHVKSEWNMSADRPRKVYMLTAKGTNFLRLTEDSLNLICKNLVGGTNLKVENRFAGLTLQESSQRVTVCRQ